MNSELVLAVDGGNSKTDLALVSADGELLSLVRGGGSSPHNLGVGGCVGLLSELLARARSQAAIDGRRCTTAQVMVAGADLPEELAELRREIEALSWSERLVVDNDTFALLRSGTDRGWGVAVVCGAGMNCVGLAPDGRLARFPALGPITGDWGGGYDVGLAALMAAARSADGRGPRTVLEVAVPAYFEMVEPFDVARAIHLKELSGEQLGQLPRVVFRAAEEDAVAAAIVDHLGDEVVALATVAMRRLELLDEPVDVVLGGGVISAAPPTAVDRISGLVREVAPRARVAVAPSAPIVGAVLLGLDELGVRTEAAARARAELHRAFGEIEGTERSVDG